MAIEITVPALGESVTEATVGQWFKKPGDAVKADEPLVELETDKVTVEVPAPAAGVLADIKVQQGTTVAVGAVLGSISEGAARRPSRRRASGRTAAPKPTASARLDRRPAAGRGGIRRRSHPRQRRHAASPAGAQDDGGEGPRPPATCRAPAGAVRC